MPKQTFGFVCGKFSVALSGNNIILPGSKNQPLKRSLIPATGINNAAGHYTLQSTCEGEVICDLPVRVVWVTHESQSQPFLGLEPEGISAEELCKTLEIYVGKKVELNFTPRQPNFGSETIN